MKYCLKHKWAALLLLPLLVLVFVPSVSAQALKAPYESYTYDFWGVPTPAPQAYLPTKAINGIQMGVGALNNPQDLILLEETAFILDSGNNRIIEVDQQWKAIRIIDGFYDGESFEKFSNPQGFYIDDHGIIYIADTNKERIVVLDNEANLVKIIKSPHNDVRFADMFPERFVFRPRKIGVDAIGRMYIIAQDLYDGLMVLDGDGNFRGFIGAPRVAPTAAELFWNWISSDEQRRRRALFLPIEFSNIDIDELGLIYAVVSGPAEDEAIKRLNPTGEDIIHRNGFHPMRGDSAANFHKDEANDTRSRFVDIIARENGMYSALDRQRGRIFSYDNQGNLLYVFGGLGDAIGLFQRPVALSERPGEIAVLDAAGRVTVFKPTEYALLIHSAIDYYNKGNYEQSTIQWEKIARLNPNYDLAYSGIGRALFYEGRYAESMAAYRLGQDRSGYSLAFDRYRQQVIGENFNYIATSIVVLIILLVIISRYQLYSKLKTAIGQRIVDRFGETAATITYVGIPIREHGTFKAGFFRLLDSLKYSLHVMFHPFDGFWDLKHEKRGSVLSATVIIIAVVLTFVAGRQYTGFVFNERQTEYVNIIFESASVLVPFFLWCGVNWALTTLMEGKGTFKDIYIATAFALVPMILISVPLIFVSNYMTEAEGTFYELFQWIALLWSAGLLLAGTMTTHEYSGAKTIITSICTVGGIAVVLFLALLFSSLLNQVFGFFYNIYLELAFR